MNRFMIVFSTTRSKEVCWGWPVSPKVSEKGQSLVLWPENVKKGMYVDTKLSSRKCYLSWDLKYYYYIQATLFDDTCITVILLLFLTLGN